jgi:hypothetical protein
LSPGCRHQISYRVWDWTQGPLHARQVLYPLSHAPAPFFIFVFKTGFPCYLCSGWPWICNPPASASWVARIVAMPHHAWLSPSSSWSIILSYFNLPELVALTVAMSRWYHIMRCCISPYCCIGRARFWDKNLILWNCPWITVQNWISYYSHSFRDLENVQNPACCVHTTVLTNAGSEWKVSSNDKMPT